MDLEDNVTYDNIKMELLEVIKFKNPVKLKSDDFSSKLYAICKNNIYTLDITKWAKHFESFNQTQTGNSFW